MTTYARIQGNTVFELVTPSDGVSIGSLYNSALLWVDVTNVSPAPAAGWSAVETGGSWTFSPPAAPSPPTLQQQATAALGAGVTITSTSTPSLNGNYACDDDAQTFIASIQIYINTNQKFPGSAGTYAYIDMEGQPHTFPDTAAFQVFATAIADYVSDLVHVQLGILSQLPSNAVTIP